MAKAALSAPLPPTSSPTENTALTCAQESCCCNSSITLARIAIPARLSSAVAVTVSPSSSPKYGRYTTGSPSATSERSCASSKPVSTAKSSKSGAFPRSLSAVKCGGLALIMPYTGSLPKTNTSAPGNTRRSMPPTLPTFKKPPGSIAVTAKPIWSICASSKKCLPLPSLVQIKLPRLSALHLPNGAITSRAAACSALSAPAGAGTRQNFFNTSFNSIVFPQLNAFTTCLKCCPLLSKFLYLSNEVDAGESETTSPSCAWARASATACSIESAWRISSAAAL